LVGGSGLNAFRRAVNDLNPHDDESRRRVTTAARASSDAGSLVDLYFSKSVHDRSAVASAIVADMHKRRREGSELGDSDEDAKAARDELIKVASVILVYETTP
jgi:hypothetical protein